MSLQARRAVALALIALALLGAQTLGLAHRVLHGAAAPAAHAGHEHGFGHEPGDEAVCPLYDQQASAELAAAAAAVATAPLPAVAAPALPFPASRATAAPSPFLARAPPVFSG